QFCENLEGSTTPGKGVFVHSVDGDDQIPKEAVVLTARRTLMAFERHSILFDTADPPLLRGLLGVFTHALAGRPVLDRLNVEVKITRRKASDDLESTLEVPRLGEFPHPVRERLRQSNLHVGHALDPTGEGKLAISLRQDASQIEGGHHAG